MNKVLFINCSVYLPGEHALKRTMYLFEMMFKKDYDVKFVTSDFNHYSKKMRNISDFYSAYPQYKDCITFIHVPEYRKNISIGRFFSNYIFEKRVIQYVKNNISDYSEIYLSLPTLYLAGSLGKLCEKRNVKFVIDVNDLWPEAYRLLFKNEAIYSFFTMPLKKLAERGYSKANCIIGVSDEYVKRALSCNKKKPVTKTVYLGAMLERFDKGVALYSREIVKDPDDFWIGYAGTIGSSYDLKTVIDAVHRLKYSGIPGIKFIILGQGPDKEMLENYVKKNNIDNVQFLGFLDYEKMAAYLSKCDLTVNCIKKRASQSVVNKVSDYLAAGTPIINSCVSTEMRDIIEDNNVGINYEAENVEAVVDIVKSLHSDPLRLREMRQCSRRLAEDSFDREKTHLELAALLEEL